MHHDIICYIYLERHPAIVSYDQSSDYMGLFWKVVLPYDSSVCNSTLPLLPTVTMACKRQSSTLMSDLHASNVQSAGSSFFKRIAF
jgi:hypothetical protein